MIGHALAFLRDELNEFISSIPDDTPQEPRVVFVDSERSDVVSLKSNRVSVLLVNVGADHTLRPSDPFARKTEEGKPERILPDIRINLQVLFAARFEHYQAGLDHLAWIIQFFQMHRVFDHDNAPRMNQGIDRLTSELVTQTFAEQNEMWGSLRSSYHPSVLYLVRMLAFRQRGAELLPQVMSAETVVGQK